MKPRTCMRREASTHLPYLCFTTTTIGNSNKCAYPLYIAGTRENPLPYMTSSDDDDDDDGWETLSKKNKKTSRHHAHEGIKKDPVWLVEALKRMRDSSQANESSRNTLNAVSILVLVGLPGSGKSTFASALHEYSYCKCVNQDELKSRGLCLSAASEALTSSTHVIIDRCNQTKKQRDHWIQLAKGLVSKTGDSTGDQSLPDRIVVHCVYLKVPPKVCIARCRSRLNHPTISPGEAEKVIRCMQSELQEPQQKEGFRRVFIVESQKDYADSFIHFVQLFGLR